MKNKVILVVLCLIISVCSCGHRKKLDKINAKIDYYRKTGEHYKALPLAKEGLDIALKIYSETDGRLASYLNNIAMLYYEMEDYRKAETYFSQSILVWKNASGDRSTQLARTYVNLARLYLKTNRYEVTENILKLALSIQKEKLPPASEDIAVTLSELGHFYKAVGDNSKAFGYFNQSLDIWQKTIKTDDDIRLAPLYNNIGVMSQELKNYANAEIYFKKALSVREKYLTANSPDVVISLVNLGNFYFDRGDFEKAGYYLIRVKNIQSQGTGEGDLAYALALHTLGKIYIQEKDFSASEIILNEALQIYEQLKGPESAEASAVLEDIARVYIANHQLEKAEITFKKALAIKKEIFGPYNPKTLQTIENLAKLYRLMGRIGEAVKLERTLKILRRVDN